MAEQIDEQAQLDHAELNIPLAKRYGKGGIDAEIDRHLAAERREERRQRRAAAQERRAAKVAREAAQPAMTAADLEGAVVVRDRFGWHRVVRVNAKSVTVATSHSWDDRIAISQIVEARHA